MSKNIELDKFYTPIETARKCIEIMKEIVSIEVSEYLEPSAGNGSFSNLIDCISYDIDPGCKKIIQADFLKLNIKYKKGRVVFGNPPFGERNSLSRSFFKKSIKICDYICFILPISQLNNRDSLYEFDLIKSIDLGPLFYSNIEVHCCFNIYKRPVTGLNSKQVIKTDLVKVYRDDNPIFDKIQFDLCIFRRGSSVGKEKLVNTHTQSYKILILDRDKLILIKEHILNFDWLNFKKHQSAPFISINDVYRVVNTLVNKNG